jgi:hypothetical protein
VTITAAVAAAAAAAAADAADGDALSAELSSCQTESDKAGLRLFNAYLKAGRQGRALEVVGGLHNIRSIEGKDGGGVLACIYRLKLWRSGRMACGAFYNMRVHLHASTFHCRHA